MAKHEYQTILFLCTGNSCRSQMAEAFARSLASPGVKIFSAGTEPRGIHPRTVEVMAEVGIDISRQTSKDLSAVPLDDIDLVITLCDEAAQSCPAFPRPVKQIHWSLPDPARVEGDDTTQLQAFREVRHRIHRRVRELLGNR